ncbi:hypothetical protein D3C83_254850 [compost metagenome]
MPQKHAEVGRELLRRVKKAFDANGIALPVSRMALQMADDAHPLLVRTGDGTGGDR